MTNPTKGLKKRLASVVLALIVAGCVETPANPSGAHFDRVQVADWVTRFDDKERDVTCYIYQSYGISCVPTVRR